MKTPALRPVEKHESEFCRGLHRGPDNASCTFQPSGDATQLSLMSATIRIDVDGAFCLSGSLRIYDIAPVCLALLAHLEARAELRLDLDGLCECDGAGIQLLFAVRDHALAAGKTFCLRSAAPTNEVD